MDQSSAWVGVGEIFTWGFSGLSLGVLRGLYVDVEGGFTGMLRRLYVYVEGTLLGDSGTLYGC